MARNNGNFIIDFTPLNEQSAEDVDWQEDCHELMMLINRDLQDSDDVVQPKLITRNKEEGVGVKSGGLELFSNFLISTGIIELVFTRSWDYFEQFFNRHHSSSANIVFPDGSSFQLNGMGKEEVLALMREYKPVGSESARVE